MNVLSINSNGNIIETLGDNGVKALTLGTYGIEEKEISTSASTEWTPPTDWIDISNVADNEINLLIGDFAPYIAFSVTVSGGYTVNWGDGTTENFASSTTCNHTYTVGAGQSCSRGYTTFKIRIYAQNPANSITYFAIKNGTIQQQYNGLLWAKFNTTGITKLDGAFRCYNSAPYSLSSYLECIELPESLTSCTNYIRFANDCQTLQKIVMPLYYSDASIDFSYAFNNCRALPNIDYRATSLNVSYFSYAHQNNYAIKSINLPTTINGCNSFAYFLQNCYGLLEFIAPTINTNCTCYYMLDGCRNTLKVDLSGFNNRITDARYMLQNNSNCDDLTLPVNMPISSGTYLQNMLNGMSKVRVITFPNLTGGVTISDVDYMLSNMQNLETVNNFPVLAGTTIFNFASTFANDYKLKNIDNLDQFGSSSTSQYVSTSSFTTMYSIEALSLAMPFARLVAPCGTSTTNRSKITSLRLTNSASTFSSTTNPQLDVQYTSLDATALNTLFGDLPTVTSKYVRITGSIGAATCDTSIATAKGWIVTN